MSGGQRQVVALPSLRRRQRDVTRSGCDGVVVRRGREQAPLNGGVASGRRNGVGCRGSAQTSARRGAALTDQVDVGSSHSRPTRQEYADPIGRVTGLPPEGDVSPCGAGQGSVQGGCG